MTKWKPYKLGDIITLKRGYDLPDRLRTKGGYPVVSSSGISDFHFQYKIEGPCVVTGRYGTLGLIHFVEDKCWPLNTTLYIKDFKGNDPKFIYYFLQTLHLEEFNGAAAVPGLDRNVLHRIECFYPKDILIQQSIASILGSYDELIEINNKRIKLLEETAKELYKEWFVRMRFPGYKTTKFNKGIPEGCTIDKIKNIVDRKKFGTTYKQEELFEQGVVVVIDQSTDELLGYHNNQPDHEATPENPIIIFGDHSCKMQLMVESFSLAENVIPITSKKNIPIYFLYYLIESLVETTEYKRHWNELVSKFVFIPKPELQNKFTEIVQPFFEQISLLKKQNIQLRQIRDRLLPRLISGKLQVKQPKEYKINETHSMAAEDEAIYTTKKKSK